MTVRTYETEWRPCEICCDPAECVTSKHIEISVEGGASVQFAVCESCVNNMLRPLLRPLPRDEEGCTCKSTTPGYHGVLCALAGRRT